MKNIILFDQDTQHYRQSVYSYFNKELRKYGYELIVVYDRKLNDIDDDHFIGIDYTLSNFMDIVKKYECKIIIQFVWLRYKFLIPFMLICRLTGVKIILWSHGINLQKKQQHIINLFYYLRQNLADALILYNEQQRKFFKASRRKMFVANNTLNFYDFPIFEESKEQIKKKYNLQACKVIISIGRMNTNGRKVEHLIELSKFLDDSYKVIIIGPGISDKQIEIINRSQKIEYKGSIYDQKIICEYYKLADIFVMPGAIGLAINQAFYYSLPVVVEDTSKGPESFYLRDGTNGFYYKDVRDLNDKIKIVLNPNNYKKFCEAANQTIKKEATIEIMFNGFWDAIQYVNK